MKEVLIVLTLIVIESLLSVDNAAVLAVMVKDLPEHQRKKALRYGLLGAYVFRGLCLFIASWLVKIIWLKILGGLYLLRLAYTHYTTAQDSLEEGIDKDNSKWFGSIKKKIGLFWSTVILVEIMDLAFSIDNVFAAVALSSNFIIIMIGVGIGILAMRFVAGRFVELMAKFPSLEDSAYIVIALLGIKLVISGVVEYIPALSKLNDFLHQQLFDFAYSCCMMLIFFYPIIFKRKTASLR
ncbi:DUF475 domain-containing protein [soil metagenome]